MNFDSEVLNKFCGSKFWDVNQTWYSSQPDFTPCFEQTVLVWIPCVFFWLFCIFDIYYMKSSFDRNIPWNKINISKALLNILLLIITSIDFLIASIKQDHNEEENFIYPVDLWTPIIKFATFLLVFIFLPMNRKYGVQTSGCQFLFWLFLVLLSIPRCRTEILAKQIRDDMSQPLHQTCSASELLWNDYKYLSFMIYFGLSCAMLLLNCFADARPLDTKYVRSGKEIPESSASFLARMTYQWFDGMAWKGYRKPLQEDDLWDLRTEDSCKEIMPIFAYHWNKSVRKNAKRHLPIPNAQYSKGNVILENPHSNKSEKKRKITSILPPIIKSFGSVFLFGSFMKLCCDILTFAQPQVLRLVIGFVEDYNKDESERQPEWKGILYSVLLFTLASIQTIILGQYFHRMFVVGLRTRTALINCIYRKALVISNTTRKESTVGEIVNLMAVDAQRFMDLTTYLNMIWSAPLQIGLALYFLWDLLGPSVLAGLAIMVILMPFNGVIANRIKTYQMRQMKYKDERVKLMNEVLNGIKVLKLYAWEPSFEKQVLDIRGKEIENLKSTAYLTASTSFLWSCAPFLVSLVTFATYVLIDENNVLDATKAFVSLSLFNTLRFPLTMLPMLITNMVQTQVSVKRINKFLNSEELDPDNVQHDPSQPHPLSIKNGSFSWGNGEMVLKNINMEVKQNTLCAVVGPVGSGKSSVIQAFLGEMDKLSGMVNTVGSIAYVPQQAWIQNATLRDNILFGKAYDRKRYNRVLHACALQTDIEILSAGDLTEIGEKGINLSGGQKQRISLARAVYSDADLYFLDDPLSAVDPHVGKHIFEEVIGPNGLLAQKVRVLVTHGITFLPQVDNIYVIKSGEISESGTYQELLNKRGAFSDFLLQYLQEATDQIADLDEIKQQLESNLQSDELKDKIERVISLVRTESVSDSTSLNSLESSTSLVRQRKTLRRNSETSVNSSSHKGNQKDVDQGKLIEIEKSRTGGVEFAVYKHYIKSVGLFLATATLVLNFAFQALQIGSNLWLTKWSNDATVQYNNNRRDMYLGVYGAFGFGQVAMQSLFCFALAVGCLLCARKLHKELLTSMLHWPMDMFDTTPLGRLLNRFSKDVDTIDTVLPFNWRIVLNHSFAVLATIVVISISTPIFLAVIIPIALLYYFAQRFYVATSRQLMRLESVSRSPIYSHFGETVTGVSTIRAYSVQNRFIDESDMKVDKNQVCKYPSLIANRWLAIRLEMVGNVIILFAALFAVLGGQSNPGLVGLSVTYALQITQILNWLVRMSSDIETNIVAVERIKEYTECKQEALWEMDNDKLLADWPSEGRVVVDNLKVRYREGMDLVLKGVSFVINGGEKVGIVGRTGAGKSSLTLTLFRIIEASEGRILIDGVDIAGLGLHTLRSRLTIIPQDPVLFSGSLRINLDPFKMKSDEEIWKSLELSHLKTFVQSLPAGLNHEITEGGENLSVGQRQLICLARALLRKTKVLVLDEATAAVDLETDDLIQKTIRSEFSNCTVLTIAHRLNTIMDSDKIIVLDRGMLTEYDSPANLLGQQNSAFYSMAKEANLV